MSYRDWVFDLDNTLYPASSSLFPQIEGRMTEFISNALGMDHEAARRLQKQYYRDYGTTLRGLMQEHRLSPDDFLEFVHDIDCSVLAPAERLDRVLGEIPGRKLIFTNGSATHAENVLRQLGLRQHFNGVFDIKAANYLPKPALETYQRIIQQFEIDPKSAIMFEDLPQNLVAANQLGMTTVWVREDNHPDGAHEDGHSGIDHVTDDLAGWLEARL